ncbi:MAG: Alkaline phosphatase [Gemmataceae bacterium]|nr:Alkaline phosphatase [Gemmataceae bacterium]
MSHSVYLGVEALEVRAVPAAAFDTFPVLPTADHAALDTAWAVAARGAALGRRTDVFMKIGDSNTDFFPYLENGYLRPLGDAGFNPVTSGLAAYGQNLLNTWATFTHPVGGVLNSFSRADSTAYPGFQIPSVLPLLAGEIAASNAGVALIMLGTNDLAVGTSPDQFRANLQQLLGTLEQAGVVPILSTIPDSAYNGGQLAGLVRTFNQVIADVAEQDHVPLWNLFRQEESLPAAGLESGGVHLSVSPNGGGSFFSDDLLFGQNVHNLGALEVLDWYRETVVPGGGGFVPTLPAWTPLTTGQAVYAVGPGAGQGPVVTVYDSATGKLLDQLLAYEPSFTGGVTVAVADENGDGIPDIITGPGVGGGPVVKVFSGKDGSLIGSVLAFEPSFRTGVNVAAADLDGDGKAEVVVGAGVGGGPAVAVFRGGDLQLVERFFAFEGSFRGGVTVAAAANLAGYGPSLVVGAGDGGGPVVKVYRYGELVPAVSYLAYDPSARSGVNVAAGDLTGSGAEQIVSAPAAGITHVRVIDPSTGVGLEDLFAGPADAIGGARVAVVGRRLVVGNGPGEGVSVNVYLGLSDTPAFASPNDPSRAYGLYVG